jgi:hypothetical protein
MASAGGVRAPEGGGEQDHSAERAPDDPVEPFYMNSVLLTLKARGFFPGDQSLLT